MGDRQKDLEDGFNIECMFVSILKNRNPGCKVEHIEGYFKDYDLKLIKTDESEITFEVKYDRMTDITGNVAVEYEYDGKASGIFASNADYIVYCISGHFRCARREELKQKVVGYKSVDGGDGLKSSLYLIPARDFISFCKEIGQ